MSRISLVSWATIVLIPALSATAETQLTLQTVLQHQILSTNLPLNEVQAYTEARVPRMPKMKSIAEWEKLADRMRRDTFDHVVFRGEAAAWRDAKSRIEWFDTVIGGPGYHIRKLRYETVPGM